SLVGETISKRRRFRRASMRPDPGVERRRGGELREPGSSSLDLRIARRLALLRAERGWSLDGVAARTGISRASLSRLERWFRGAAVPVGRLYPGWCNPALFAPHGFAGTGRHHADVQGAGALSNQPADCSLPRNITMRL